MIASQFPICIPAAEINFILGQCLRTFDKTDQDTKKTFSEQI